MLLPCCKVLGQHSWAPGGHPGATWGPAHKFYTTQLRAILVHHRAQWDNHLCSGKRTWSRKRSSNRVFSSVWSEWSCDGVLTSLGDAVSWWATKQMWGGSLGRFIQNVTWVRDVTWRAVVSAAKNILITFFSNLAPSNIKQLAKEELIQTPLTKWELKYSTSEMEN